jgi:Cdc6-like AAA superfamily ATPase
MASRAGTPERVLIGREAELAAVREVLNRAADGQSETLLVFGEAGVGKTGSSSTRSPALPRRRCC